MSSIVPSDIASGAARQADAPRRSDAPAQSRRGDRPGGRADRADRVDLSAQARRLAGTGNIRRSLVEQVRTQIENGTYENNQRIQGALDRVLQALQYDDEQGARPASSELDTSA